MENTSSRNLLIAAAVLVGIPLTLHLWQTQFDRFGQAGAASPHLARGDKALVGGRYVEAIAAFNRARELVPTDPAVQRGMMRARAHLIAEQPNRISIDNVEDVRYELGYLLETDRQHAGTYMTALGNIAQRLGQSEEARTQYEAALKADPNSPITHAALGNFYLNQKDGADKARSEFDAALKLKSDFAPALTGLGQLSFADGKAEAAESNLEKAAKLADDFSTHLLLGNVKLRLQKNDEAIAQFQRAVQLDPRSAEAARSLGQAYLAANKIEDAEKALRVAAGISQDQQTVLALGFALARGKKPEQAMQAFNTVLQQDPNNGPALYGAGALLDELGKKADAATLYKKLLSLQAPTGSGQMLTQLQQQAQARLTALASAPAVAPAAPVAVPAAAAPGLRRRRAAAP